MKARCILPSILIVLLAGPLRPSELRWTRLGLPEGGPITAVAIDGDAIYAGAIGKVFRSLDNGAHWKEIVSGLLHVSSLTVSGRDLFVHISKYGVHHYRMRGEKWTEIEQPRPGGTWFDLHWLAVIQGSLYAFKISGIYRSRDAGANWEPVDWGELPFELVRMAISDGRNAYTLGGDVGQLWWHSLDGQGPWVELDPGWPPDDSILGLALQRGLLFVLTEHGLYRSAEKDTSWEKVGLEWFSVHPARDIAASDRLLCAATEKGVAISSDGGSNWRLSNSGLNVVAVQIMGAGPRGLLASSGLGLFLSKTEGASWKSFGSGLPRRDIFYVGTGGSTLFVTGPPPGGEDTSALFASTDQGANWRRVGPSLDGDAYVHCIAADRETLFVGTEEGLLIAGYSDRAWTRTWPVAPGPGPADPTRQDPARKPDVAVNSLVLKGADLIAGTDKGVFRSPDRGRNWQAASAGMPADPWINCLHSCGDRLLAGTVGIFFSDDNGLHWTESCRGIPEGTEVLALCSDGNRVFAGTDSGVFESTDSGESWHSLGSALPDQLGIEALVRAGSALYATDSLRTVWRLPLRAHAPEKPR